MLDSEGIGNPHNPRPQNPRVARRAGLIPRLKNTFGFEPAPDNTDLDYGYSRREKIVFGIAGVSLAAATILGINYKESRVQEHYDRNVPGHVDSDTSSDQ